MTTPLKTNKQTTEPTLIMNRYALMRLQSGDIPKLHNILASFFTWLLLSGFIVFPSTFTSLRDFSILKEGAGKVVWKAVQNIPLIWIAAICCSIGAFGMCWLWWHWNENYEWLVNHIFLPGLINSMFGLVNTLISVYTAKNGRWSITAIITGIMTGSCTVILLALYLVYNMWLLARVKKDHKDQEQLS